MLGGNGQKPLPGRIDTPQVQAREAGLLHGH